MNTKKIYKGIKNLALAAVVIAPAMFLSSCNDTLDMPSYTENDLDFVFSDLDKAELFVKGCYRGLIHEEQYRQFNTGETVTHPAEEDLSGSKYAIANYYYDPITPYTLSTTYSECYRIIEQCNVGLKYIANLPESDRRNAFRGEMLMVRAYCYHNLIRFYGDVPAVWSALEDLDPDAESTFYPTRTSRDEIYDHIIADMQEAVEYIPWYSECDYGTPERLSKQAALGILARICLHAGGYSLRWDLETNDPSTLELKRRDDAAKVREFYQIADDALKQIIDRGENKLIQSSGDMSGFQTLWCNFMQRNYSATSDEIMWQIAEYGTTTNSTFGVYNGQPGSSGGLYGQRKTLQFKLPTYYLSFDENDTRRDVTCCDYSVTFLKTNDIDEEWSNVGTTYSCIMSGKFRIEWGVEPAAASQRNVDIPVLRYADVLLMYAETQNYLNNGPTAAAISALQQVRDRAGIGSMAIPTTEDDFLEAIMQERKWELADEFTLRSDLIRTNLLDEHIHQAQQDLKDLSDKTGKYAGIATYRLYKYCQNSQTYGDTFLTVPYIDITDPDEIALIETAPTSSSAYDAFNEKIATILANHGITDGSTWYATRMFEAWNSTYNKNCRRAGGFGMASVSTICVGQSTYTKATGSEENGGSYPEWVAGDNGLYYAYEKNKTELLPFANSAEGHPMVDNPNLTQHPGYAQ
ncbi:MAG: RagB/SusD family nutrient uptake outer membrane protein [Prevotella sp.]|nr:RagB/SusD family nutrient uptake outer membrane protein [Prevotella sp.]